MTKNKVLLLLTIFTISAEMCFCQQNLVLNPSFEDTIACPTADNQLFKCVGWVSFGSPEYFHSCSSSQDVSVPNNWGGFQFPSSGEAYVAVATKGDSSFGYSCNDSTYCDSHEYIGQWLSSPLTVGMKYYVSIKASLSISSEIYCNCATNNLGLLFRVGEPTFSIPNQTLIKNFAHISSSTLITDSSGWTTISGSFIADSAYQYIVIGNFFDDPHTTTQIIDGSSYCNSYYYIDDICVSSDSATCFNPLEVPEILGVTPCRIYPNPTDDILYVECIINNLNSTANLFNSQGQLIRKVKINEVNNAILNVNSLSNGIYVLQIKTNDLVFLKKIIVNH